MLDGARGALVAAWGGALLVLLLAWFGQLAAAADIISSSKLESCIANGTQVCLQACTARLALLSQAGIEATAAVLATAVLEPCMLASRHRGMIKDKAWDDSRTVMVYMTSLPLG